ncbi:MFS transporter [Priestia endophytica]|uniref:MFS transporter n=1 Tax=Priestia endophytica TaxID=135735 RepID=UPI00203B08C7|nr:MFS transporter [Priestia endophytica]MCM3538647.1 MFS transporter [Priestia endophytica]
MEKISLQKRWLGVLALLIIVIIAYIDRINVSVLITNNDFLTAFELHDNRILQGQLMTIFLIGYGLSAFFITPIFETFLGYRRGLILSIILWAIFTAISPLAGSIFILLIFRAILGASEGPLFSLKTMYINEHFNSHERGKPNAVSSMGVSIGLSIGFPIITFIIYQFSWVSSFYILSAFNILIGLPLILFFIQPSKHHQNEGKRSIKQLTNTFITALKTPGLIWVLIIEVATLSYLWGSSSWLPAYLLDEKGFSIKQMGIISSLPFIFSILSKFLGGYIIDRIANKKMTMIFFVGGLATSLSIILTITSNNIIMIILGLILANGFWGIQGAAIPTLVQHLSDPKSVGSTYGIINGLGNFISAFIPAIMGYIISLNGNNNISSGFYVLIGTQLVIAICGLLFTKTKHVAVLEHNMTNGVATKTPH